MGRGQEVGPTELPLPQELRSEDDVLAGLLRDYPRTWPEVRATGLQACEFCLDGNAAIFARVVWLGELGGDLPDPTLVSRWLAKTHPGPDWYEHMLQLVTNQVTTANVGHNARLIRQAAARRGIVVAARKLEHSARANDPDLQDHLDMARDAYRVLHEGGVSGSLPVITADELLRQDLGVRPLLVGGEVLGEGEWLTLVGEEKTGKSVLALDLACSLVQDVPDLMHPPTWCGFPVMGPVRILFLVGEGGRRSFTARLLKRTKGLSDAERKRIHLWFPDPRLLDLTNPEDFNRVRSRIMENGIQVVFIDPLAHFHSLDENATAEMKKVAAAFLELVAATGVSVIAIHHTRKAQANSRKGSAREGRGSTVLSGANDGTLVFDRESNSDDTDDERRLTFILRHAENTPPPMMIQINRATLRFDVLARDVGVGNPGGRPASTGTTAEDCILWLVAHRKPATYDEIASALGAPKRSLQRWFPDLMAKGQLDRRRDDSRQPWRWFIPKKGEGGVQSTFV